MPIHVAPPAHEPYFGVAFRTPVVPSLPASPVKRLLLAILLVLTAACADRSPTQYVGSVMNEATPEAEGSLRLTLFSRTDTSFSGVIELGAPARGTGSAHAWYEGPELRIVTVGAASGDTILWSSRLADPGLGGRFEITGGERAGQQGTWRARLVKGPPATLATLRTPPPTPLPSPTALWPVLLLLAVGVGLARWIRRAPRAPAAADGTPWLPPSSRLSGLGGWLALFTLGQAAGVVVWLARAREAWNDYVGAIGIGAAMTGMQPLAVLETAMSGISLPVVLGGLFLLGRRSRYAPRYWFAYLAVSSAYLLVDVLATQLIHPQLVRLVGADAMAAPPGADGTRQQLRQLAIALAWTGYWATSRRVRATFGAAALDRAATAPAAAPGAPPAAPPAAAPVRDGRRWRRVALRTAGGVVAALLALLAIGLWSVRATPYSVAEGADIRASVAGRWTWASDTAGCRNAHTIAFADGGKVMTITSADVGASDPVTTYDVQFVSRSTIRGAIRGETRMTDDGKPVVWDLVLTSPDEYRWKRTDWRSTPWSYTGRIRRCPAQPPAAGTR